MIGLLKSKEPHLQSFFSSAGDMVPFGFTNIVVIPVLISLLASILLV
jgi:hypothetical protein